MDTRRGDKLLLKLFGEWKPEICAKCGHEVEDPIYFNNEPYHSQCLPEFLG